MSIYSVAVEAIMQCFLLDENNMRTGEDVEMNNCPPAIAQFFTDAYDQDGDGKADPNYVGGGYQ